MRFSTLALATLLFAVPAGALAQDQMAHGMHGFFTPEQRYMYIQEQKANGTDWRSMTPDQRHAQMQSMRTKFETMSDADKTKLRNEMQAKFDALPPAEKQSVEQKIAQRQARHEQRMQDETKQQ